MATSMTATASHLQLLVRPGGLPVPVLEQIQRDLVALPGVGMSMIEISHRSKTFEGVIAKAEADIRALAGIPVELQGAVPAGRREPAVLDGADEPAHRRARTADYIITGSWAEKAVKEAKRVGHASTSRRRPRPTTSTASRRRPRPSSRRAPRTCT